METATQTQTLTKTFSVYFKEIIYGGIDGIVTTFAVVAGFAGAALANETTTQLSFLIVLLFGLANLFADAASMGLGNFLSVRSEKDLYTAERQKLQAELKAKQEAMLLRTEDLLRNEGFKSEQVTHLLAIYQTNEAYWLDFLLTKDLELSDPRGENEVLTGLATFVSFMIFGAVPLLPFMLEKSGDAGQAFALSIVGTGVALCLLGLLKWRVVGGRLYSSMSEVLLVGGTAAVLAYAVGTFFVI